MSDKPKSRIDINALKRISEGDPESRVTVKRKWLKVVYQELVAAGIMERIVNLQGTVLDAVAKSATDAEAKRPGTRH